MINQPDSLSKKAKICLDCPVCRAARKNQRGFAYGFVKHIDRKVCPFCKAYENETGQRAYEPLNEENTQS